MITPLSEALTERGYDTLTPVQEAVSAPDLAGSDLLVSAQTGSGKTVGFGIAIAPTLLGEDTQFGPAAAPLALVVAPTRELAFQVMRELDWLYSRTRAIVTSCVGGMDMRQERRALDRGAHIVVGTPGRLRDHIERGSLDLSEIRAVVLDEADEMLDLGFREDLEFMLGEAPEEKRTLLFSATVPPMIATLAEKYQRNAKRISTISKNDQHADISYQALRVAASDSEHAIFNLLRFHDQESAIVFANTRAEVNHLSARLANRGLATVSLSGELSQTERTHALQAMRDGRARVCVATDVAARGIDLPNLNLVIHADLPSNTEGLLHRSGRTGRAGRKGISALIVPPRSVKKAERLLKWAKITAEWTEAPSVEDILRKDEERLLSDPAWNEAPTEEQSAFAAKLLELHSPEAIAAAYLRLYQANHSAPEELQAPDTKAAPRAPRDFGPSRWVSLSVGHDDRAEARWILPLLCRAGNIDKTAIGAIRVQKGETFVELSEPSIDGFMSTLGADGVLEEGIAATLLDSPPNLPAPSRGPRDDRSGPRGPRGSGPKSGPRSGGPKSGIHEAGRDTSRDKPRDFGGDKPREQSGPRKDYGEDRKPRHKAPREEAAPERLPTEGAVKAKAPAPASKPKSDGYKPKSDGYKSKSDGYKPKSDGYKSGPKSGGKPFGKPGGKPAGKPGAKPAGKSFGKPGGKPAGAGKPKGKPAAGNDARDSSKRFTPPGKAKAAPRKPRAGGDAPPRRSKS